MPRTALGRARLASLVDLVSRPLDFEYYPGVFKFQNLRPDFEIDESGGIGARPRLGGGAELLARRPRAARRTQRARG